MRSSALAKVVTKGTTVSETIDGKKRYTTTDSAIERKKRIQYVFFWLLVIILILWCKYTPPLLSVRILILSNAFF